MAGKRLRIAAAVAALLPWGTACLGPKTPAGPERSPGELHALVLGPNQGLSSLRSVVEARLGYAGRTVSLPGVLLLDGLGGFRLDLLDPLDRPVAMIYSDEGRIVQYRPGTGVAASLGVLPGDCRGVSPQDWVSAVLASSPAPPAGDRLAARSPLYGGRVLEMSRNGALRQSIEVREAAGGPVLDRSTWFCGGEPVLRLRVRGAAGGGGRRLPSSFEVEYLKAGLTVSLDLREVESNPSLTETPVRPRLADGTRWTTWRLP